MSRDGSTRVDWGGEADRPFRLGIGELKRLQDASGCGPLGIAARCLVSLAVLQAMREKDYVTLSRLDLSNIAEKHHLRPVFLQGLLGLGGEVTGPDATTLVRDWVDDRPLAENLLPAYEICMGAVLGVEEDPLGELEGEAADPPPSPTADTAGANTTAPAPSCTSPPERSTPSPSGNSPPPPTPGAKPTARPKARARSRTKKTKP